MVAVQKGLQNIAHNLRAQGYDVVTLGEYNYPIDAVVYKGRLDGSYITSNNMPSLTSAVQGSSRNFGVLMINSENKSAAEINQILKSRVYSPLF